MNLIKSKEEFFEKAAPAFEDVEISDGFFVRVREIPASEFTAIWSNPKYQVEGKEDAIDLKKITPALIQASVVNSDENRIFEDMDAEGLEAKIGAGKFFRLGAAARKLNGVVETEKKEHSEGDDNA